jgi:hypothetical protein
VVCKKKAERKARSSSKRRGQRFSLLSKKKEDSEGEPESKLDVTTSLIEAAVKAEDRCAAFWLCNLHKSPSLAKRKARSPETVEEVARPTPAGVRRREHPTQAAALRTSREEGYARAVKGYHASGKKMFRHPIRYIKRYVRQVEMELGRKDVHSS